MAIAKQPAFEDYLALANQLADRSAAAILPHFRQALAVENKAEGMEPGTQEPNTGGADKPYFDPVTVADRAAESTIREAILATYPDHGIIGEEYGEHKGSGRFQWVIDPIDGTRAFIMGYPTWGTLIGLIEEGEAVLGIMNQPFTGERFWSDKSASFCRIGTGQARRLQCRGGNTLADAVFATTDPALFAPGHEVLCFEAVKRHAAMTRFGGDCYAYCMLAAGLVDVIVESGLQPYDIVALIPIVERAGGIVTTWDGGSAAGGGRILASGSAQLHGEVIELLAQVQP